MVAAAADKVNVQESSTMMTRDGERPIDPECLSGEMEFLRSSSVGHVAAPAAAAASSQST